MIRRFSLLAIAFALALLPAPDAAAAQGAGAVRVEGQVLRHGEPFAAARVVLHRVAPDTAGPVNSARADGRGRFSFRLHALPDPVLDEVVYFASVRHQGVLYFGPAFSPAASADSPYTIQVFDTVTAPAQGARLAVEIRHIILEPAGDGWRATDLIQLTHTGERTYVAAEGAATWSYPLAAGATEFQVGESDLAPDAVTLVEGRVRVTAPIPPGQRLYLFRYRLPHLFAVLPLPGTTGRLELLVREPAPALAFAGLQPQAPVELDGDTYRRWVGTALQDAQVRIVESPPPAALPVTWVAAALAVLLAAGALYGLRRGRTAAAQAAPRERILLELARLDEEFAGPGEAHPENERRYRERRAALKEQLRALDAAGGGGRGAG